VSFYVSTATFFLLHCDEWDRVVALPRHKFITGATLLQLIDPPTHGILSPLPMVFRPPTYGISNPLLWYYELLSFGRNEVGFNLPWGGSKYNDKKLTPGSKYHMENWTWSQNIIGKSTLGSIYHGVQNTIWHRAKPIATFFSTLFLIIISFHFYRHLLS
jgi:hypothetical protein